MTSWVAIPIVHLMGGYSIAIPTNTVVTFLLRICCVTIFVSAFFDMSKVLGKARTPIGNLTLISTGFNPATGGWWSSSERKQQLEAELTGRLWGAVAAQSQVEQLDRAPWDLIMTAHIILTQVEAVITYICTTSCIPFMSLHYLA